MSPSVRIVVVPLLLAAACSSGAPAPTLIGDGGPFEDASASTIDASLDRDASALIDAGRLNLSGRQVVTYVTELGEIRAPGDISQIQVLTYSSSTGAFLDHPVIAGPAGSFTAPDVPAGTYYVRASYLEDLAGRMHDEYAIATSTSIDLSYRLMRRPNVELSIGSRIDFTVTGLSSWEEDSSLLWVAPNAGVPLFSVDQVQVGPTSTLIRGLYYGNLIEAAQGDHATVLVSTRQLANGISASRVTSRAVLPSLTVRNGATTTVSASFEDVARSLTTTMSCHLSAFADALPRSPRLGGLYSACDVASGIAPILLSVSSTASSEIDGSFTYGNPLQGALAYGGYATYSTYALPGNPRAFLELGVASTAPLLTDRIDVRPIVGAVVSPTIDGQDATQDLSGIGSTPLLSWSAPVLGRATAYRVALYVAPPPNVLGAPHAIAFLNTTQTSVRVPPGLLRAGSRHVLIFRALASLNATQGYADLPSGLLSP
jgi:hypothetical protein